MNTFSILYIVAVQYLLLGLIKLLLIEVSDLVEHYRSSAKLPGMIFSFPWEDNCSWVAQPIDA